MISCSECYDRQECERYVAIVPRMTCASCGRLCLGYEVKPSSVAAVDPRPGEWSDAQIGRLIDQSQQISRMLSEAGVGSCTLVEGVRALLHRQSAACQTHGDPLVCLACEAEESARPEWRTLPEGVDLPRRNEGL